MNFKELREKHDLLTLLVAAIAVALSQFPPAYEWFYSSDIEVNTEEAFVLTPNAASGISVAKHFSATNTGEEPGRVIDVLLNITDNQGKVLFLSKASRFRLPKVNQFSGQEWSEFSPFPLSPYNTWSHLIAFNKTLRSHELDSLYYLQDLMREEQQEWKLEMEDKGYDFDSFDEDIPLFKVSDKLLEEINSTITKKIPWFKVGEYNLYEVTITDSSEVVKSYAFTITKRDIKIFLDSLQGFSNGIAPDIIQNTVLYLESKEMDVPTEISEKIEKYKAHNKAN